MFLISRLNSIRLKASAWAADIVDRFSNRSVGATYQGASTGRLFWDWIVGLLSPDSEIRGNASLMRARARDLSRNNSHIAGFLQELESNMIGPEGIQLQAKIRDGSDKLNTKTNFAIEAGWKEWCYPEHASLDTRDSWTDLERLIVRNIAVDGEVFVRRIKYAENPFNFAVQLLDPDMLDDNYNRAPDADGNEIRMGVEINKHGKPLRYWFWERHPNEMYRGAGGNSDRVPIEASELDHLFIRYRPGQTRGITWFAPILTDVKMLDGYEEAELVAMRFAASKMGFVQQTNELAAQSFQAPKPGEPAKKQMQIAPGTIDRLGFGETFAEFNPTHPNAAFVEFTKLMLRGIARALGVSYLTLTGDLSAANYSSMRAGLLPERDHWRMLQKWLSVHCHRRVYRDWIAMALLTGRVKVDSRIAADYYAVEWKPRGWRWVDPANDLEALEKEISLGINSRQRACAERGVDYEDIVDEISHEEEYADAEGVDVSVDRGNAQPSLPEKRTARDAKSSDTTDAKLAVV